MSFQKQTIRDVPLEHKTVLLRADYNVPLEADGKIADDYRLQQSLPTLKYLLQAKCKIVIVSHLGRPEGRPDPALSLKPVAKRLAKLLGQPVEFVPDCVGDRVKVAVKKLKPSGVVLLENLRFHPGEKANDPAFAKSLAQSSGASYFVQDGFGIVHRADASTQAVTHFLPSVAGFLLEKEVSSITRAMHNPKRPFVAVVGGAKVSDKISVIEHFVEIADHVIIGGALANTFLKFKGVAIGKSRFEPGQEETIARIYQAALKKAGSNANNLLILPVDAAVAPQIGPGQKRTIVDIHQVQPADYILDLGPASTEAMLSVVKNAGTVVWSGTLGVTEHLVFAYSSAKLAGALEIQKETFSVVGGGDTSDFVLHWGGKRGKGFGLVSTGGSASLELMAGQKLPGVEALLEKR